MILELLLNLIYSLFEFVTTDISIPALPESVHDMFDSILEYVTLGAGFVSAYTHFGYLLVLFNIIITVELVLTAVYVVLWILKKVPMLGIE